MSTYQIGFPNESVEKRFEKELAGLPRNFIVAVKKAIETLSQNPRPLGKKFRFLNPPVVVKHYLAHYRLRVGNYRILYDIDEYKKRVILLAIRKRAENTYK
ncbi:MAG: type II toxin-antitoxin system RelE/ParE family toxin [Elusimicrobiota bacterium]